MVQLSLVIRMHNLDGPPGGRHASPGQKTWHHDHKYEVGGSAHHEGTATPGHGQPGLPCGC
jgi:hypothetical protein